MKKNILMALGTLGLISGFFLPHGAWVAQSEASDWLCKKQYSDPSGNLLTSSSAPCCTSEPKGDDFWLDCRNQNGTPTDTKAGCSFEISRGDRSGHHEGTIYACEKSVAAETVAQVPTQPKIREQQHIAPLKSSASNNRCWDSAGKLGVGDVDGGEGGPLIRMMSEKGVTQIHNCVTLTKLPTGNGQSSEISEFESHIYQGFNVQTSGTPITIDMGLMGQSSGKDIQGFIPFIRTPNSSSTNLTNRAFVQENDYAKLHEQYDNYIESKNENSPYRFTEGDVVCMTSSVSPYTATDGKKGLLFKLAFDPDNSFRKDPFETKKMKSFRQVLLDDLEQNISYAKTDDPNFYKKIQDPAFRNSWLARATVFKNFLDLRGATYYGSSTRARVVAQLATADRNHQINGFTLTSSGASNMTSCGSLSFSLDDMQIGTSSGMSAFTRDKNAYLGSRCEGTVLFPGRLAQASFNGNNAQVSLSCTDPSQ